MRGDSGGSASAARGRGSPVAAAFWGTRVALLVFAYVGLLVAPVHISGGLWQAFPDAAWLDGWARFDSGWYWTVAERGYYFHADAPSNVNFFPLFPAVAALVAAPLRLILTPGQAFYAGGVAVSWAALWVALRGVFVMAQARLGEAAARRSVWLLALFPFSFFFGAAYSESLFLALAIWAFVLADRDRWVAACVLAALCGVARIPGFLVAVALAVEYLRRRRWRVRAADRHALAFLITPLPVAALMAYFWVRFADPLVFVHTQTEQWGRTVGLHHLRGAIELVASDAPADLRLLYGTYLVIIALALVAGVLAWRRLGAGHGVLALASLAVAVLSGVAGTGRYVAVLFPVFLIAGEVLRGWWFAAVVAVFVPLLLLFTYFFTHWHLVT